MRILLASSLSLILAVSAVLTYACSRQSFINNARTAHQSYLEAEPLFKSLGIPTENLTVAIKISQDLLIAFEQDQNAAALDLLAALIRRTNEIIANDLSIIKDEDKRIKIMAVLALANIALHWIANNIVEKVEVAATANSAPDRKTAGRVLSPEQSGALETVRSFAATEPWGKAYVH
jgi:hypothetical protein